MKTLPLAVAALAFVTAARAQTAIDWLSLDAAGSTSSSAAYSLGATLGQPDAASCASANYTIIGGFWALESLSPGAALPQLRIAVVSPTQVKLWWASPATGFELQSNPNVANSGTWSSVPGSVSDDGLNRSITLSTSPGSRFFRLRKN